MEKNTYFDGLVFHYFGINKNSKVAGRLNPLFYGLQYVHTGKLELSVDRGPIHHLNGPIAFLTYPESYFEYFSPDSAERNHYYVCFSGPRVEHYIKTGLFTLSKNPAYIPISSPDQFLSHMLELILMLQYKEKYPFAVAKLEFLLLTIQNQNKMGKNVGFHQNAIESLARKIMMAPEKEWNFQAEAAALHICPKHFLRLFRSVHGMPPHRFLLHQRLFKAAEMLIREKISIKMTADACGFKNEFYFSNLFKKYFTVSPDAYRNKKQYTTGPYIP